MCRADGLILAYCNIPRFYQILGEFFFAFDLYVLIENSQGFKTFELYLKTISNFLLFLEEPF
jgi:hypothetical protein